MDRRVGERWKNAADGVGARCRRDEPSRRRRRAPGCVAFRKRARKIEGGVASACRPLALG